MRRPTTIRLSETHYQRLEAVKSALTITQTKAVELAIDTLYRLQVERPPVVLRWLDINALAGHPGEIDWSEVDCPECGETIDRPFKALMADGSWSATVCSRCATRK